MKLRCLVAGAALLVATAAPRVAAQNTDAALRKELPQLRKDVYEAELALLKTRIVYYECSDTALRTEFEELIDTRAKKVGVKDLALKRVEGSEPVLLADGRPSPLRFRRLDISGHGPFFNVHQLLHVIAIMRRKALDFETVHVKAETGGTVSFDTRIAEACFADDPHIPLPAPPPGQTAVETIVALYRARLQDLRSTDAALSQLGDRFHPMQLIDALAELDEDWGNRAVLLTELRYTAPVLTLHGLTGSASARAAIDASLRKFGFDVTRIEWSPAGDCRAFTATARLKPHNNEPATEDILLATKEIFGERFVAPCSSNSP